MTSVAAIPPARASSPVIIQDIKNVSSFFVVVDGNKIIIYIDYSKKSKVEFDFEFSSN